ncbi:WSC domain-domain-containing protein [Microdochium bolleyi]|uniref:WSC domain-domain-containing protein n=1 Tax=Microdochium bolleyi TaxID=196109 RepID=A0A136IIW1_9PEZI|nr:WSC domain-domain-containing protein [Microdochium bolleyi]
MVHSSIKVATTLLLAAISVISSAILQGTTLGPPRVDGGTTFLGCFSDHPADGPALDGLHTTSPLMTIAACARSCSEYRLFGLEHATNCYCGNELRRDSVRRPKCECSMKCAGDASERCGGVERIAIYKNDNIGTSAPTSITVPTTPASTTSMSSTESSITKLWTGDSSYTQSSSIESTSTEASLTEISYTITSLASTTLPSATPSSISLPSPSVSENSSAETTQVVGSNLFATTDGSTLTGAPTSSRYAGFMYHGCYADPSHLTLSGAVSRDAEMTLDKCAAQCKDYSFFGAEDGASCYCGTSLSTADSAVKLDDDNCSIPCLGDTSQTCGSTRVLSIYYKAPAADYSLPKNHATLGYWRYKSCWISGTGSGITNGQSPRVESQLTVETCADACEAEGSPYFAVVSGSECICGDVLEGSAAPEFECGQYCDGDYTEWCGGPSRLSVSSPPQESLGGSDNCRRSIV